MAEGVVGIQFAQGEYPRFSFGIVADDRSFGGEELAEDLPAGSTGGEEGGDVGAVDGEGGEGASAFEEGAEQGGAFGAHGEAVRSVLHVGSLDDGAVVAEEGCAYVDVGVGGVGEAGGGACGGEECLDVSGVEGHEGLRIRFC